MRKEILVIVFMLFLVPAVSAEIMISQPASVYNLGDDMVFNVTLRPQSATNDFLVLNLVCNGVSSELHKEAYNLGKGETKELLFNLRLDSVIVGDLHGSCVINANYGLENKDSQGFTLSREILVIANPSNTFFDPGESVVISGRAMKKNGAELDGFVEVGSSELGISVSQPVNHGNFSVNIDLPAKASAKGYVLNVRAYEKDSNGIVINEGNATVGFNVNQIVSKLDVALSSSSINSGEELLYSVVMLDQDGQEITGDANAVIYSPSGKVFSEGIIRSDDADSIKTETNYTPGAWKISVQKGELKGEKIFYINELKNASFVLDEDYLIVKNTGNVPYEKSIEIIIGNVSSVKNIKLDVGESKKFLLKAPDGRYNIKVKDGTGERAIGSSFLTGRAISVKEGTLNIAKATSFLVWFFLILLFCGMAFVGYKRVSKKKYIGREPIMAKLNDKSSKVIPIVQKENSPASGREVCSVVNINLKNLDRLRNSEGAAAETIRKVLEKAKDMKAKLQIDGNFRAIVFSPSLTKKKENIMSAINYAQMAEKMFNEHNRKYGQKIDFGIGVHQGEMIAENKGGKTEFTSVGNVSLVARKLSDNSQGNVLMSGEVHRKTLGKIKVERIPEKGWQLNSISNREIHSDFIKGFLKRQ